jgi:molybdate transport system substrate-binding protein
LVQKGNPKHISNLGDFAKANIKVVLGDKNTGSVGKITKSILTLYKNENWFDEVYEKSIKVPTSVEIIETLKNNQADVSINWKAAVFKKDNNDFVDFINIPYIAPKQKLFLTTIKFSKNLGIAKEFVDFVFAKENKRFIKSKGF